MRKNQYLGALSEAAVANWEGEGGSSQAAPRPTAAQAYAACVPSLPPGFEAQPAWGFADQTGCVYELNRVYGPAKPLRRGASPVAGRLDEDRSYWVVTWSVLGRSGETHPAACWLTFAEARRTAASLTFARFCSATYMREDLAALRC